MSARTPPARLLLLLACALLAACASPTAPVGPNRCYERGMADKSVCTPEALRRLDVLPAGQSVRVTVDARCQWNPTGIILERGATYELKVAGRREAWTDSWQSESDLETGWTGLYRFSGGYARHWARAPRHPIYALMGAQGYEERYFFVVGEGRALKAEAGEELMFFANDWPGAYENNHGCLQVDVRKLGQ